MIKVNFTVAGDLNTNVYLISDSSGNSYMIDPAQDGWKLKKYVKEINLNLMGIIITHFHLDHIRGITAFDNLPIYISKTDWESLTTPRAIEKMAEFYSIGYISDDEKKELDCFLRKAHTTMLEDYSTIPYFDEELRIIKTPGHTAGSICIYAPESSMLFSGDTLFYHSYGRVDLPTGSAEEMYKSLAILSMLPLETKVFPGHGQITFIKNEIEYGILGR